MKEATLMRGASTHGSNESGRQRVAVVLGGIVFVLTPWLTLGFATPVAFLVAAVLFRHLGRVASIVLWVSTVVYGAALVIVVIGSGDSPDTVHDGLFAAGLLVDVPVAGVQALALLVVVAVQGHRPRLRGRARRGSVPGPASAGSAATPGAHRLGSHGRRRYPAVLMLVALVLGGVTVTILLTFAFADDVDFATRHRSAPATVVAVKKSTSCSPSIGCVDEYVPTVAFLTADGQWIRTATTDGFRPAERSAYVVGRSITVHYDPDYPGDTRLHPGLGSFDAFTVGWYLFVAALGVGTLVGIRHQRRVRGLEPGLPIGAGGSG